MLSDVVMKRTNDAKTIYCLFVMYAEDNNIIKKKRSEIETKYVSRTTIKQFNEAKLYSKGFIYLYI